jgi:hypothetical protein
LPRTDPLESGNIRLKLGQFLFASFNRTGYKLIKSRNLDKFISQGSIIYLCSKGGKRDEQTFIHAFLPEEKLLAISCVTPALDSSGRPTSRNRTVIINTRDLEEAVKPLLIEEIPISPPKELTEITLQISVEAA